jgi:ureidoacrylate peracid hydrolase
MTKDSGVQDSFVKFKLPGQIPPIALRRSNTAVLVIDMQVMNASRNGKYARWAAEQGISDQVEYYFHRLETLTIGKAHELIEAARREGVEVIYTRVASITRDGREMGWRYKAWNMTDHSTSEESQVLPALAPGPNDLVVLKTCTSVFLGSNLDRLLRNIGITNLVVCGVATNGCVESTVRDASDLEYSVILAEDACATVSQEDHDLSVRAMCPLYAIAMPVSSVIEKLRQECGEPMTVAG